MRLDHGDTLFVMIPDFSNISYSSFTHCICFRGNVLGFGLWGGVPLFLYPWTINLVCSISPWCCQKISQNSSQRTSNCSSMWGGHWVPSRLTFKTGATLAGEHTNLYLLECNDKLLSSIEYHYVCNFSLNWGFTQCHPDIGRFMTVNSNLHYMRRFCFKQCLGFFTLGEMSGQSFFYIQNLIFWDRIC